MWKKKVSAAATVLPYSTESLATAQKVAKDEVKARPTATEKRFSLIIHDAKHWNTFKQKTGVWNENHKRRTSCPAGQHFNYINSELLSSKIPHSAWNIMKAQVEERNGTAEGASGSFITLLKSFLFVLLVTGEARRFKGVHQLPLMLISERDHRGWVAFGEEPGCLWTPEWRLTRRQNAGVTSSPRDRDGCVFGLEGRQAWSAHCGSATNAQI